ncbi:hypothetical protein EXIGLDRAFT_770814 [Exidia glandulosa HHB12029]|uniref:Non-structural maintenance of chromosomes element 1 homolog n=1 Tax=Exidia glandulosa HHB12029 TaxID=1314781 RepID=A0A165GEF6_EXIGL|nr:hypothetical protein EXIGLDRAFT_770814 [Exidia glandulosa HHB12029]
MLGTRARMELEQYLLNNFEDLSADQECVICTALVFSGVRCTTTACKARLHKHCYENIQRRAETRNGKLDCPSCRSDWTGKTLRKVGEEAAGANDDQLRGRKQQESDEEGSEEERPARIVRKKGNAKGKKKAAESDEEDEDEGEDPSQMEVDQEEPEPGARRSSRRRG